MQTFFDLKEKRILRTIQGFFHWNKFDLETSVGNGEIMIKKNLFEIIIFGEENSRNPGNEKIL